MKGLRAGGLAMVFGLKTHTEKNGKVVTLFKVASPREGDFVSMLYDLPPAVWWRVTGLLPNGELAQVMAANLIPIDDTDPDAVEEKTKEKETPVAG